MSIVHSIFTVQVRGFVEHVGLYVGLAVYTLAGAKVDYHEMMQ